MFTVRFDPRTKLVLWLFTNVCLFVFLKSPVFTVLSLVLYFALFLLSGKRRAFFKAVLAFAIMFSLVNYIMPALPDALSFLLTMVIIIYILYPSVLGAIYVTETTSVGEVTAAARKMHVPDSASMMFVVMLRFLPTVRQEFAKIRAAMKLRRIKGLVNKVECVCVPMLVSVSETAEDLGESITARGIENPCPKTSWHQIGFHAQDVLVFVAAGAILAASVCERAGLL